ncbi:MAG: phosphoribosyltransferase family protein [Burkholderiaceae bacterium]
MSQPCVAALPGSLVAPLHYRISIAGKEELLPIVAISSDIAIALMITVDMGIAFVERVGRALATLLEPARPDIVLGAATMGIPVAIEVSRALGLDRYVIAQKSPKIHLGDAFVSKLKSITSSGEQKLMLDRRSAPLIAGRRVAVVDDVISTGSSIKALIDLVRQTSGEVVAIGLVLDEGSDWKKTLGADAALVRTLAHIPVFKIAAGQAVPIV